MNFIGNNCKIDSTATIGENCCIGDNTIIRKNVIIGDNVIVGENCVIGAGSVVVKDIPANSFAAGNPCKVIRTLTEADSMIYKPEILGDNKVIGK